MVNDNYEDLVKCGYLEMKLPRKHRKFGGQAWKSKWFILRRKSAQGYTRLEYFKSEEACYHVRNKTVVDLRALKAVEEATKSRTRKTVCKLAFSDTFMHISSEDDVDMKEWVHLIKKLVLPSPNPGACVQQPEGSFLVTVINTEDSEHLNLAGDYVLVVTDEQIVLYRSDHTVVAQWDLDDIPRFRLQKLHQLNDSEKIFIVNLARTSEQYQGEYQFLTKDGRAILEAVKSHTKKRIRTTDSHRSSPVDDFGVSNSTLGNEGDRSRTCSVQSHLSGQSSNTTDSSNSETCSESSTEPLHDKSITSHDVTSNDLTSHDTSNTVSHGKSTTSLHENTSLDSNVMSLKDEHTSSSKDEHTTSLKDEHTTLTNDNCPTTNCTLDLSEEEDEDDEVEVTDPLLISESDSSNR